MMEIISQNILQLINGYLSGDLSREDELTLSEWIGSSEENYQAFKNYISKTQYSQIHTKATNQSWLKLQAKLKEQGKKSTKEWVLPAWLKVAAIFLVSFALGALMFYLINSDNVLSTNRLADRIEINAPKGSKSFVKLPDGTKVWLNSDSKIFYSPNFGKKERAVELEGEAFFDVVKNTSLPFKVNASEVVINVTGTMFNLKAYPEDNTIETTLEEGEVIIERKEGKSSNKIATLKPKQRAVITKDDKKVVIAEVQTKNKEQEKEGQELERKKPIVIDKDIDTKVYTSWKENKLVFRSEKLPEVLVRLERWYGVKFIVQDDEILNYHFNGTIENETVTQVMKVIQFALPIQFEIEQNVITIQKEE